MVFLRSNYHGVRYAENSRETFRKQAMHSFRAAAIIEDNGTSTNSPNYRYRVTAEALSLFRSYGTANWSENLSAFLSVHKTLKEIYASKKRVSKITVDINGLEHALSAGAHNQLQKAVIEEFAPRFLCASRCLYLGDTSKRDLIKDVDGLRRLGLQITLHDKMPDIVLYVPKKDWLVFIECVTSVGPMSEARLMEINQMTSGAKPHVYRVSQTGMRFPERRNSSSRKSETLCLRSSPTNSLNRSFVRSDNQKSWRPL